MNCHAYTDSDVGAYPVLASVDVKHTLRADNLNFSSIYPLMLRKHLVLLNSITKSTAIAAVSQL
jgi:hypothetical protein